MKIFPFIRYFIVAIALKFFSLNVSLRRLYRFLGNNLGQRHTDVSQIELDRGRWLVRKIREAGFFSSENITVLELGTGWTHFYAIFLRLFMNVKITLFDVQDNRNFASLKQRCKNLFKVISSIPSPSLSEIGDVNEARDILTNIIDTNSVENMYKFLNMTYLVDPNGSFDLLPDNSFDIVFSVDVLEHVHRVSIQSTLHNIYRVLKPGGITIHQIGLDDHLTHYAPGMSTKNYMRYSTATWKKWFENGLQYINRLQLPEFLALFNKEQFILLEYTLEEDESLMNLFVHSEYSHLEKQVVNATRAYTVHQKPALS